MKNLGLWLVAGAGMLGGLLFLENKAKAAAPAFPNAQGSIAPAGVAQVLSPSTALPQGAIYVMFTGSPDGKVDSSQQVSASGMLISAVPVGAIIDNGSDQLYQKSADGNAYFAMLDS
jgi:hypothetical protein